MDRKDKAIRKLMEQSQKSGITGNVREDIAKIRKIRRERGERGEELEKNNKEESSSKGLDMYSKRREELAQDIKQDNIHSLLSQIDKKTRQLERHGFKPKMRTNRSIEWVYTDTQSRSFITFVVNDYGEDFGMRLEVTYRINRRDQGRGQLKYIDEDDSIDSNNKAVEKANDFIKKAQYFASELFPSLDKAVDM